MWARLLLSRVKLECPKCKQPFTEFRHQNIGSPENLKFDQLYSFSEVDRYRKYIRNLQEQNYHVLQLAILLAEREIARGLSEQSDDIFQHAIQIFRRQRQRLGVILNFEPM
jgi:hypothetical protein